jgi:hypothetical protein
MDPMVLASFVAFFALIVGCLIAPNGAPTASAAAQAGAAAAD